MGLIKHFKTISKDTIIYGIGGTLSSVVSFLLLPLYTRFLTPEDYGYLTILTAFQTVLEIFAVFGLSSGFFRYYLMAEDDTEKKLVLNTSFWTQMLFICIIAILVFSLIKPISLLLFHTAKYSKLLMVTSLTGLLSTSSSFSVSYIRAKRRTVFFTAIQIARITLQILLNVYFVVILKWKFTGVVYGNFVVTALSSIFLIIWMSRLIDFSFSTFYFKKIIKFIYPIFIGNLLFFLMSYSDRFFLNAMLSKTELGLYSFGQKIGAIVMIGVISPFSYAVVPYALSIAKEDHFKKTFSKIIKYFLLIMVFLSLIVFFFSKEIILLIANETYIGSSGIIGFILVGNIFYALYYNLSIALDIVEKTYLSTFIIVFGAIISIAMNYFLIPIFGIYGSALAVCIANGVIFLSMYYYCQKNFKIQYENIAFLKLVFLGMLLIGSYLLINTFIHGFVFSILVKSVILIVVLPFLMVVFKIFDHKERQFILSKIRITLKLPVTS